MPPVENQILREKNAHLRGWGGFDRFSNWAVRSGRLKLLALLCVLIIISMSFTVLAVQFSSADFARVILSILLFIDLTLILAFAAILTLEIVRMLRKRGQSSQLQRRLVMFFVLMAMIPILLMALFSTLTLNIGVEGWFSSQVQSAVSSSYETALAYEGEHRELLERDGDDIYRSLVQETEAAGNVSAGYIREILEEAVAQSVNIAHAFVLEGDGEIYLRGKNSYEFNYREPSQKEFNEAEFNGFLLIEDRQNNEFRYLRPIPELGFSRYLYLTRPVDGSILTLLDQTEETALFYKNLEASRLRITLLYAGFYLIISLIALILAISAALYLARRMTKPVNQLVSAVSRMSAGEANVRVPVGSDTDELNLLSRGFNEMSMEVEEKQNELRLAAQASERERQRFNSVLEGVSSGVIGLDRDNNITFINPAAKKILSIKKLNSKQMIDNIAPEFTTLIADARKSIEEVVQSQIVLTREGRHETLFVRVARRNALDGLIISFDDVSNLVEAQRLAAWGDVARRIAHEIKNPLTPIRLSAERMERIYGKKLEDDKFSDLTQIIIRQTEDLRRIVDEFSRFSKMPDPIMQEGNLILALQDSITLQAQDENLKIHYEGPKNVASQFDASLMRQAFGNLIKNASEAIMSASQTDQELQGRIDIRAQLKKDKLDDYLEMRILDNGIGLPENHAKLFEPYVTMKASGTGLGLPIVRKIIEDHGGTLVLRDREDGKNGAEVLIHFPILTKPDESENNGKNFDR